MRLSGFLICFLFSLFLAFGQSTNVAKVNSDPNFHLYLLIGQSNMAGRADVDSLSTPNNHRVLMLDQDNRWVIAQDPLHFDKPKIVGV